MIEKYVPGSEWIYLKFYIGRSFADKVLTQELYSIIKQLKKNGYLSKFFFIRYADPHYHLRLRMLVTSTDHYSTIVQQFYAKLKKYTETDVIWKIQLDTYNRETDRYNKHLMESTESLFGIDSRYAIEILKLIDQFGDEDHKWKISLKSIDGYLNLFDGPGLQSKLDTIKVMSDSFKAEYGFNDHNAKVLNGLYRDKRKTVEHMINESADDALMKRLFALINKRDKELAGIVDLIKATCIKHKLSYKNYIGSYIHMNINRLIPTYNRPHELLLYDYISRFYESEIARKIYS